jgi:putative ABC transport system ATP-binding protein
MAAPPAAKSIEIRGLQYAFGEGESRKQVLFDVDLDVAAGEFVILTGPSGSGKTTLLSLIGALRTPQQGKLRVMGREVGELERRELEEHRQKIGFIFQLHNLFPALTAYQSVQMSLDLRDCTPQDKHSLIVEVLSALGLSDRMHYKPDKLSGGQRQRVAIARALVHRPRLVLADEPTAALDRGNSEGVLELFRRLAKGSGSTILMVTQDARVFGAADRLVQLVDGRIAAEGPAAALDALIGMPRRR